ncbi:type I restriction endonuclease [Kocuria rhizophila]|uniref:type I restriction endonuclease subunit R n=1 Tax=Kocuria rhizophila TaxID=72000 RepID=UPI001392936C|nr:type I restriction endonuclease [Kocuria rhizophila]MXN61863.1 type I restriction endonuclease subunit R [Bacillus sp. BGMRC0062]WSQ04458.1 type I restriction endonuclease [Kocuria rhizophila]
MSQQHQEKKLQQEIATYLSEHGWLHSPSSEGYEKERAIFPEDVLGWLENTDPENFAKVVPPHGDDAARAKGERRILDRLTSQLSQPERDGGGVLNVLRKGFLVPGARRFKMLQMPPADDRNPQIAARYAQNRLRVVQEVVYSTRKADRIDLVFFLNGLPVATVEIKTDFTQSLQAAIKQYETDRTPAGEPLLTPFRGALVHFALTDHDVYMTTELKGPGTSFLPFNRGHQNGAGNPPNPNGARSSYFWEETLERDTWLSILTKFVYVNHQKKVDPRTGAEIDRAQIRFPRYHQWRAVSRLTAAAREDGPGHKYLIQHSAGSGKTDSIAWTAHRMATLHTAAGEKVFNTVFVIADRQVLDRQLQDAVDQLVNSTGQFQPITSGSEGSKTGQLIEALSAGVPIIGVTLQTFPYALSTIKEKGGSFEGKRFAVIADEAHSSQSGNAASAVKELLYLNDPAAATGSDSPAVDENGELEPGADQDALVRMAAQADDGHRISYFAFTATPKAKTIELFGTPNEAGKKEPFDLYSMKQAIQEGFILDVLKNYTTYERVAKIALRGSDPANVPGRNGANGREGAAAASSSGESAESGEVDVRRGTRAYIGFVELHPTNVSSKVDVIVKHYLTTVQPALNGRGKAMVVTGSRAAAVQYQRAFQRHIERENLPLKTLVAFSGTLPDPDVAVIGDGERPEVTEASMNPDVRGRDLAAVFNQDDQNILIVANKYQTGFDQPLLVGMYVDKQLSGIAAVQTLSRLNRRMDGKTDTYVLDFVNDPDQILAAFQEYYEDAEIKTPSDLDLVIKQLEKLKAAAIFTEAEVDQVWDAWNHVHGRHTALLPGLDPAVSRFMDRWDRADDDAAERDTLEEFRSLLGQYVTSYAFFSQILNFGDPEFIKLSVFADLLGRQLNARLDTEIPETVTAEDVVLTHYHLEKQREEDLKLQEDQAEGLRGLTEVGMSKQAERERAAKAELVEKVNKYLGGLDASDEYKVTSVDLWLTPAQENENLRQQARNNTPADFARSPELRVVLEDSVWRHNDLSEKFAKLLQDMPTDELVSLAMAAGFYERLRGQAG